MPIAHTPLLRHVLSLLRQAQASNSRREFLQMASAAGVSALVSPLAHGADALAPAAPAPEAEAQEEKKPKVAGPVAIVGGGIAGLTTAYRLMKAGIECHVYEGSERFGGRMYTKRGFNKDGMFAELGGELVDTPHTALMELAKELGVEMQSLKEGETGVDFYHHKGKTMTNAEFVPLFEPLAKKIAADAEGLLDEKEEFTAKAKRFDGISLKDYLQQVGAGIERWVVELLETAYTIEYGVDPDQQSALNLIDFIGTDLSAGFEMFGESDEAFRVKGGNETLAAATFQAIKGSVKTFSGHRLVKIGRDGEQVKLTFVAGGKLLTPSYAHVVCSLPFTMVREVQGFLDLPLSAEKKKAISEMGYGSNLKVMVGYTERHWRKPLAGRTAICNGNVYADLPFQTVWETSRGQEGQSGILTNFMGGSLGTQYTPDRLDKMNAELDQVFPGIKAKADGAKTMMNWPAMKWMKGSYSCYLVGQYTWIAAAAAATELDGHLLFAGEHTSADFGGFMNGAIESGNRAAAELGA
jgi:monoamine oxidase